VIAKASVSFHRFHLPGSGKLLFWAAGFDPELRSFPLNIPMIGDQPTPEAAIGLWLYSFLNAPSAVGAVAAPDREIRAS
jgi:hypothetical protein